MSASKWGYWRTELTDESPSTLETWSYYAAVIVSVNRQVNDFPNFFDLGYDDFFPISHRFFSLGDLLLGVDDSFDC